MQRIWAPASGYILKESSYLQPQKYAQVPGRNVLYGVNHVRSLGI